MEQPPSNSRPRDINTTLHNIAVTAEVILNKGQNEI